MGSHQWVLQRLQELLPCLSSVTLASVPSGGVKTLPETIVSPLAVMSRPPS